MKAPEPKSPRPAGITVLGILAIIIGVLGIVGGVVLLLAANVILATLSALAVVIGILYLAAEFGLFVSILSLIRNLAEIGQGMVVFGLPGIIVAVIIIYYLTRPHVKVFFGRGPVVSAPSATT